MIIGLVGFKQIGKSTAAAYLQEKHGFDRHNFKDALVAEMKENLQETIQAIYDETGNVDLGWPHAADWLFQEKPPIFRALMQNYGTDVRRKGDSNYWTRQWRKALDVDSNTVTDDVRFKNEAQCIKANQGIIIRLTRPDVATGGTHVSETEQLDIVADYTIDCEKGDHQKLYDELDKIVAELK